MDSTIRMATARLKFELQLVTNVRLKDSISQSEAIPSEQGHVVTPLQMLQDEADKVKEAARRGDDDDFERAMEGYVLYRLFHLLGLKAVPPTLENGAPTDMDFEHPDTVEVVEIKDF